MRTTLGRIVAVTAFVVGTAVAGSGAVGATPDTSTPPATEPTTTVLPPMVAEVASGVTPQRGTQAQLTETLPPPASTLPPDTLPANSGTGRRLVYSKSQMRVWAVEANGTVAKTHLVSGRKTWNQPSPGTYSVFSRSSYTCNIKNPNICWHYMVRFTIGPDGDNIGFHEIPKNNGVPVQSVSQLGLALSSGCVRQAPSDALWVWNWAPVGTKVVVLG
jgi:lipoprotein-anchoring transpeptidase ErfK/SrfK